jgi:integrase
MSTRKPLPRGVDLLPSGAFRARFNYQARQYSAVHDTAKHAEAWIVRTRRDLSLGLHQEPAADQSAAPVFQPYADAWLARRRIKESTRGLYAGIIATHLIPVFGRTRLDRITPTMVSDWHTDLLPDHPTRRAHAYALLRTILNTAVEEDLIAANPCRIKGAGQAKRASRTEVPTVVQVAALAEAMPPGKYRTMTLMAAWCGLRFGELAALRRKDVELDRDGAPVVVKVQRGVYRGVVDTPKSAAGVRGVAIPPHIRSAVAEQLAGRPKAGDALLFPGKRSAELMAHDQYRNAFYRARAVVGLPTLRPHDLRHFSATTAARTGASLAELQARLGHSTVNAAMRYQHAVQGRDAAIAEAMSRLAAVPVALETTVPTESGHADRFAGPDDSGAAVPSLTERVKAAGTPLASALPRGTVTLSLRETSRILDGTPPATIKQLITNGRLAAVRDGRGALRVLEESINEHLRAATP